MTLQNLECRRAWMGVLARANPQHFLELVTHVNAPAFIELRQAETGMIMVQGRISGSGPLFNLGEMTVTRCSISVLNVTGHAMVMGRNLEHARWAAVMDGLLCHTEWHGFVYATVVTPLIKSEALRAARRCEESGKTKVEFFTMVRGED